MVARVEVERDAASVPARRILVSSKFSLPAAPAALVPRVRLDRLIADDGPPVVSIVAPAGYGKTTLFRQWADWIPNPAYVALDARDNDAVLLISGVAWALDKVEPVHPDVLKLFASPGRSVESTLLPTLVDSIWARRTPTFLMIDDVHNIDQAGPLDALAFLMLNLPTKLRLAISSRRTMPLPLGRLRAAGHLLELDASDLALDESEVRAMAAAMGVAISEVESAGIVSRTEGWPAATYLGLRSLGSGARHRPVGELRGTEASISDFMRWEMLDRLDPETRSWLRRSSVLDTMTGPLCDAALGTTGSSARLRQLERDNVFVVALDAHRVAYRYHRLFRDLLRDELDEREPGVAAGICANAAAWYVEQDDPENAVEFAHDAGDMDRVAQLVMRYAFPMHWTGRLATLARWLDWFDRDGEREKRAALAILSGWVNAMEGRIPDTKRWLASAERSPDSSLMPDGAVKESWLALLRGYMAASGLEQIASDKQIALDGLPQDSPFRQAALLLGGFAEVVAGSPDSADELLAEAVELAEARGAIPGLALALGQRAIIALGRGDVVAASRYVESGLGFVRDAGMEDFVASALLHGARARTALANGSPQEARLAISQVNRMRPDITTTLPIVALQMRFETIRACLTLREVTAARTLLVEVKDILRECPDLGTLVDEAADLERAVESLRAHSAGPWTLTAAELRLLTYLPTHLTFREIADRLFVSTHTVKTQAMAIYGKLGVSSRRGAIEQGVEAGLLDASVIRIHGISGGVG